MRINICVLGKAAANHARRFQTIQVRHADVHDDQVRTKLMGLFHGILPVHGFPANLAILARRQQRANAPADYLVIVCDQNPHSALPLLLFRAKCSPPHRNQRNQSVRGLCPKAKKPPGAGGGLFAGGTLTNAPA